MELLKDNPSMNDLIQKLNEVVKNINGSLPSTENELSEVKKLISFGSDTLAGRLNAKLWYFKTQELMTASTELCEGDSCFVLKDGATTGNGTFEYWYIYKTNDVKDIINSYVDLSNPDLVAVKLQDMTLKDIKDTLSAQISDQSKDLNTKISNLRTDTETALSGKADLVDGLIPASQLPSYVDDVIESWLKDEEFPKNAYAKEDTEMTTPITPEGSKIYVNLLNNKTYRWGGNFYVEISKSLALGETAATAFSGNRGVQLEEKIKYLENYVTPEMFGAVGDGTTDDTKAIQKAIDNGDCLIFLDKTYVVSSTLYIKKPITIRGLTATPYKKPIIRYKGEVGNLTIFKILDCLVSIFDICIDGNSCTVKKTGNIPDTNSPTLYYGYYEEIENVTGIEITGNTYGTILENIHVIKCSKYGFKFGVFNMFSNLTAEYCNTGYYIATDSTGLNLRANYCATGYEVKGNAIQLSNIRADECVYHGLSIGTGLGILITNALLDQIGYSAIDVNGVLRSTKIDCHILRCGTYYYNNVFTTITNDEKWKSCALSIRSNIYDVEFNLLTSSNWDLADDGEVNKLHYGLIVNNSNGKIVSSVFNIKMSNIRGDINYITTVDLIRWFCNLGVVKETKINHPTNTLVYELEDKTSETNESVITANGFRSTSNNPTKTVGKVGTIVRYENNIYISTNDTYPSWLKIPLSTNQ